ncbi:alpha/beta fold hydrolase [Dyella monticola]|uniref:Alpha/beta fold hydrolase n=1 Tax=Dyella monticola TaxID=1927958 RepID=A0A370WSD2_9GAMM|nr:alpha/beta fold hydrolase [Dyella monticola]RDS79024.1 alpha/beta fold hydrolase [Dyella monticola]
MSMNTTTTRPLWQRLLIRRLKFLGILAVLAIVILGGSYLFAPQWLLKAKTWHDATTAQLQKNAVQAGDTRWVYYEGGNGPTIVLLHGFAANKDVWLKVAPLLTAHFHVVIPDLPGWGESSRIPGASYNIDNQAERLDDFIQTLHLQHAMIVGHSMGGAIAGVYAAEHPQDVAELALVDSFGLKFKENDFAKEALAGKDPFVFNDRAGFERATALAFEHVPHVPGRFIDVFVKENIENRAFIDSTFNELRENSQALSLQTRLDKLTMPVLGMWCHDDKIIDISALESLRDGLTHAPSISTSILNGCNHMPQLEKSQAFAQVLTNFILAH